ncbi:MAG: hypothetical protein EPO26_11415 [Chloroflexota bacterium]|nr:MAG: hypothetical protein EPO26_11415 [Chloroflexota bacterium]
MNRSKSWRPFGIGLALVALIVSAVLYSASAFAYTSDTTLWQQSTSSRGILNGSNVAGTFNSATVKVGSPLIYTASYTVIGTALGQPATPVRTLYQQYWHRAQNDFFWIYALNNHATGSSAGSTPVWHVYNYVPGRGATLIVATVTDNTATASPAYAASYVYLGSGTNRPALTVDSVSVTARGSAGGSNNGTAQLAVSSRWGLAQEGFGAGVLSVRQSGETYPVAVDTNGPFGVTRTNYSYFDAVASADTTSTGGAAITLSGTAPAQTAANVTNATGTKYAQSAYTVTQVSTDADGDLNSQQLIFVNSNGDWFRIGTYQGRTNGGFQNGVSAWGFYDSSRESAMFSTAAVTNGGAASSGLSGIYLISSTISISAQTAADRESGGVGVTSQTLTYSLNFSPGARGSWTTYARAEDWHGQSSGGVYGTSVGALTVA